MLDESADWPRAALQRSSFIDSVSHRGQWWASLKDGGAVLIGLVCLAAQQTCVTLWRDVVSSSTIWHTGMAQHCQSNTSSRPQNLNQRRTGRGGVQNLQGTTDMYLKNKLNKNIINKYISHDPLLNHANSLLVIYCLNNSNNAIVATFFFLLWGFFMSRPLVFPERDDLLSSNQVNLPTLLYSSPLGYAFAVGSSSCFSTLLTFGHFFLCLGLCGFVVQRLWAPHTYSYSWTIFLYWPPKKKSLYSV